MSRDNELPQQPMLPGMNAIEQSLLVFYEGLDEAGRAEHELAMAAAEIIPVQQTVAAEYDTEVRLPREAIWHETLDLVSHTAPVTASRIQVSVHHPTRENRSVSKTSGGFLMWRFQKMVDHNGRDAVLETTVQSGFVTDDAEPYGSPAATEFNTALSYLDPYTRVLEGRKCPDSLLGVAALGARSKKYLPDGELRHRLAEAAAPLITEFRGNVKVTLLGTNQTATLAELDATQVGLYEGFTTDPNEAEHRELQDFTIDAAVAILGRPEIAGRQDMGKPQAAYEFLRGKYCRGLGQSYETMHTVNELIKTSVPVPPKPAG